MRRRAALAAAVVLLCTACSGDPAPAPARAAAPTTAGPTVPAVPGIDAEVVRLRTDVAVGGQVHVRVTDTGDQPFTITALALDSPGFEPLPAAPMTAAFAPRRVIELPVRYGEPRCTAEPAPVAARLTVLRPDGAAQEVRVPLSGDDLDVVHREECAVAGVLSEAAISLMGLTLEGDEVRGAVVLTRRGSGDRPIVVTDARGSVVLDVSADGLPLELGEGDVEASVAVAFTPATCAPHVLAETKQPFVFPLLVAVGDREGVPVPLPVEPAQVDLFWALVAQVCEQPA
ncbi:hypothetical protein GCU56_17860 [Geodermatophilus sabuli]|uniref:Lipoprotein n=1 Tax=Geodermatophilus sabuli TaxID=1564158 RepID=A0A7K3W4D4_9ACTN|nr:hypothetical protein [Geodermatophilus sabuli]NEK59726.1 hypothetical protein [Geodermatophilus sabuli]